MLRDLPGGHGGPSLDERVLPLEFESGERFRRWESVIRSSAGPSKTDHWEQHLKGSPSLMELFRGFRRAGGPISHHRQWVRQSGVGSRPHAHEHYTLAASLELLASIDQVNAPSLVGAELLGRRMQLIESAYEQSRDGKTPDFFHAEEMLGAPERPSGAVISSTLEKETADRLKEKAEIYKQIRKAKEGLKPEKGSPAAGGKG